MENPIHPKTAQDVRDAFAWIKDNFYMSSDAKPCKAHTAYKLKHLIQRDISVYLTEQLFIQVMRYAGFNPTAVGRSVYFNIIDVNIPHEMGF
jgi:hypothetical protein